ncbi:RHS repeat-associated core domain-containing protein [Brevibacillus sp. B_LB10_24]|uniref:RHS repeat-associated core domain-containing protein n=1 Tax=Brevibacillus sp. B_LB10_24 TaxID=3380645 RepID=UPI0038B9705E
MRCTTASPSCITCGPVRYFDPSVGRFISEDTYKGQVENPLSLNRYVYTYNNPLRYFDPTGHDSAVLPGWNKTKAVIEGAVIWLTSVTLNDPAIQNVYSQEKAETKPVAIPVENTQNNKDKYIILYHGTTAANAFNIHENGIDLSKSRSDLDFGKEFYVTRNLKQAQEWAGGEGLVVVFKVKESEF